MWYSVLLHTHYAHTHAAFRIFQSKRNEKKKKKTRSTKVDSVSVETLTACNARNEMCSLFGLSSLECIYGGCPCSVIHIITIFHYYIVFYRDRLGPLAAALLLRVVVNGMTAMNHALTNTLSVSTRIKYREWVSQVIHFDCCCCCMHAICTHCEVCHFYFRRSS